MVPAPDPATSPTAAPPAAASSLSPLPILAALVAGVASGFALAAVRPGWVDGAAAAIEPVGTLWLHGLQMTIVPLVVGLLIIGIARTAEAARAGRVASAALIGITAIMALSATIGMVVTQALLRWFPPAAASTMAMRAALGVQPTATAPPPLGETIAKLVPANVIDAAARSDILPLLIFTLVFAFAVTRLAPDARQRITGLFAAIADALIIAIGWVLRVAPAGVFALAFVLGARTGVSVLGTLIHYIAIVSAVGLIVALAGYPLAVIGGRISLPRFIRAMLPVQTLALSTQASLACLPIMLRTSEDMGVPEPRAALILPMAVALMRATGPAMNVAVAVYVAHLTGVAISPVAAVIAIIVGTLASMGSISLPGTLTFIANISPICLALGVPITPLALFIAVETLPDLVRTVGNVTLDVALTLAISRRIADDDDPISALTGE